MESLPQSHNSPCGSGGNSYYACNQHSRSDRADPRHCACWEKKNVSCRQLRNDMGECQRKTFNYLKRVYTSDCPVDGEGGGKGEDRAGTRSSDLIGFVLAGEVDVSSLWCRLRREQQITPCWPRPAWKSDEGKLHITSALVLGRNVRKTVILQRKGRPEFQMSPCALTRLLNMRLCEGASTCYCTVSSQLSLNCH